MLTTAVPLTFRAALTTHSVVSYIYSKCTNWEVIGFPLKAAKAKAKLPRTSDI